ncbi:extracellular triacylglycerol lipase precursor [Moniliophthora roreri]|nr:extracellular triacylglycerol lipase precursor [Moniliophthora roreri]
MHLITVFGESAGGFAIKLYLLNGNLEGLARGAQVVESGGSLPTYPAFTRGSSWTTYVSAVESCNSAVESQNTIECLRRKATTDDLFDAFEKTGISPASLDWTPVLDGPGGLVPDYASQLDVKVKIPVIYGDNLDEGYAILASAHKMILTQLLLGTLRAPQNITGPEETLRRLFDVFAPSPAGDKALENAIAKVIDIYTDDPSVTSCSVGDIMRDSERRLFARKMNEAGVPMYSYQFSDPNAVKVIPSEFRIKFGTANAAPGSLGVPHTSEIEYVFGNLEVENDMMPDSAKELSTVMMDYWIAFTNGMNPNDGKGLERPEWGVYTVHRPVMMQLKGGDTKMIADTAREEGIAYLNRHAIVFNRLPTYPALTRDSSWTTYVSAVESCNSAVESQNTIECLRRKATTDDLFDAFEKTGISPASLDWTPVLDGPGGLVPDYASQLDVKVKIPVIYGDNLDEGYAILASAHKMILTQLLLGTLRAPQNITGPEETLRRLFDVFAPSPAGDKALENAIAKVIDIYTDDPSVGSPFGTGNQTFGLNPEYKRYASILGDIMRNCERRLFARKMNEAGVPTYGYQFSDPDAVKVIPSEFRISFGTANAVPGSLGVPHTSEIEYVFGNLEVENDMMPDSAKELSTVMMDYWIAFTNGMNPNDGKGLERPEWGVYTVHRPVMMQLKGGDTKMIADTAREEGIAYLNRHAIVFNR